MSTTPFWVSAFLDLASDSFDAGVGFWRGLTGYPVSESRGELDEFATLLPPDGDDYLRIQRRSDGRSRVHLDLHVPDPTIAAGAAVEAGAHVVMRHEAGYVVLRSPGGFEFCFVSHSASVRPRPAPWPGGRSMADQACLDIPPAAYDVEVAFWATITGWEQQLDWGEREFARLLAPDEQPLRWLIQRLDTEQPAVTAHLDVAAEDRDAEVERHVALGATLGPRHDWWTVLTDPSGLTYCVTRREPR